MEDVEVHFGMAELAPYIWGLIGIVLVLGIVGIVRSELRKIRGERRARGTAPGEGHTVLDTSWWAAPGSHSMSRTWLVTKDPQQYAKGFAPSNRREK